MNKEINFGIGFVTGRSNVCKVINSYYNYVLEQLEEYDGKVNCENIIISETGKEKIKILISVEDPEITATENPEYIATVTTPSLSS